MRWWASVIVSGLTVPIAGEKPTFAVDRLTIGLDVSKAPDDPITIAPSSPLPVRRLGMSSHIHLRSSGTIATPIPMTMYAMPIRRTRCCAVALSHG